MRDRLRDVQIDADVSVVLFGSWGRGELTEHSDDDWAILVDGSERADVHPGVGEMEQRIEEERKPGTQDVFGAVVFGDHLVDRIGLQDDESLGSGRARRPRS
jgi:predicted nucleotidyltransferase